MEPTCVIPHAFAFTLPNAEVRSVYQAADTERRLDELHGSDPRDHGYLCSNQERMLGRASAAFRLSTAALRKWSRYMTHFSTLPLCSTTCGAMLR